MQFVVFLDAVAFIILVIFLLTLAVLEFEDWKRKRKRR